MALSSAEAEYKSLTNATCEDIWIRTILWDMRMIQNDPTCIFVDNSSCFERKSFLKKLNLFGFFRWIADIFYKGFISC